MNSFFIMPDGQVIEVDEHINRPDLDNNKSIIKWTASISMWINADRATPAQVRKANRLAEKYDLPYIDQIW